MPMCARMGGKACQRRRTPLAPARAPLTSEDSVESDLIYDVGAHKGEDTDFYLKKGFRVVGIEANAALHRLVTEKFARFERAGQLRLLNIAISREDGPITFYENESVSVWGTTSPDWALRNQKRGTRSVETVVQGRRFEHVLREYGVPYYLKIDIEGADLLCIEALQRIADRPKYVSLESSITSWDSLLHEFKLLRDLGYRWFKVVNQLEVAQQVPPNPPREGPYVRHMFPDGSTGLFGDEAPGVWLTERQALRKYRRIFMEYRLFGNDGLLTNFNWKRPLIWRFEKLLPERKWHDTHASL
jgi:FkbM family methyltransferase